MSGILRDGIEKRSFFHGKDGNRYRQPLSSSSLPLTVSARKRNVPHMRMASVLLIAVLVACNPQSPPPSGFVIVGASVLDGTGADARNVNVVVEGDSIRGLVDEVPSGYEAFDAGGLTLAPGFIDTHSHGDRQIETHRDALAAVSQGVTTLVSGQDGGSMFPLAELFSRLEREPPAVNIASFAGHGTLRREVMGEDFRRPATEAEVEAMRQLLTEELVAGALGLSSGLEYDPGIYSETGELVVLAREAAAFGGSYISHLRSEDRDFWNAVDEILTIGRDANLPVQISHTKLAMRAHFGKAGELLQKLDEARAAGVTVFADIYPYTYWQSTLTVLFPERNFDDRDAASLAITEITSPEGMLIPVYRPEPSYAGKTLAEIASIRGTDPETTLMDLIRMAEAARARGETDVESVIATSMEEADIEELMKWEPMSFCSDGALEGAHPRGYGSFPRVLGRYVRERGVLSLPDAVRKMTSLPATQMGFADRGRIAPGMKADLVLFDSTTVIDRATPDDPHAISEGIHKVWVNGALVYSNGKTTGAFPGRVLKRGS
ncbi:MAG TPA: D-aminoacylase [Vicinamibacteria bacterium]|nr:D-aminoacylase [Vicinamibacteria bacterium]